MATDKWIEIEGGIAWQDNNETVFTITGASLGLSSYFTVNESTKTVKVKSGAFSAATADSTKFSLAEEDGYTFTLATDIAQAASISTASLSFTGTGTGTQTLTGDLEAYYTLTPLEVTYHAAQSDVNLATIEGLSAGAGLSMNTDNKTIMLDAPDLKNSAVTLSIEDNIAATNYGFKLGLFENGSASSSLGFGTGDNIWTVSSDKKSAIYQNTTNEGWTLINNGMGVSYAGVAHEDIASISGFIGEVQMFPTVSGDKKPGIVYVKKDNSNLVEAGVSAATSGTSVIFTVKHDALATNTTTTLTLTKGSGASAGLDYKLAFDAAEQTTYGKTGGDSTLGLSAKDPYWTVPGGKATYQFNTTEGWTLDENAQSIAYSKAHSTGGAAGTFEDPTTLASFSGLKNGASFTNASVSISGTSTAKTITILNDSIFDITADGKTAYFTDAPGDDVVYSLALSSGILQKKQVTRGTSPTLSSVTNGTAYVKATLDPYYSLSGASDATVTYYAKDTNANIATITGLNGSSPALDFFTGSTSIILLDSKDLGDKNVSLTQAGYSQAQTYSLSLATTGTDSVLTTAAHVDKTVTATLAYSSANNNYEVFGTTLKYYTLDSSAGSSSVTYNAPEQKVIATISGLSTNGVVLSGGNANVSVDSNDHRTIYLPEEALGTGTIELVNNKVGGTKAHGLKLQLVSSSGASVSHIGIEDSGAHWKVASQSATYQHYTTAGWSSITGIKIEHQNATTPEAYFYIKGLSTSVQNTSGEEPTDLDGVTINNNKVVTIDTSILSKTANKEAKGEGYTFNLKKINEDTGVETTGTTVGFENKDGGEKYWTVTKVGDGTYTLNYKYDIAEGWEIDNDGNIKYTALNTKDLAQITGLTGLDKITDFAKHYTNEEVGIDVIDGVGYTFKLSTSLLGTSAINLTSQSGASSTDTFELAIAGSSTVDDKTFYGFNDGGLYWSVQSGQSSATYQHNISEGWTLNSTSQITYTGASANQVVATVTGLKVGVRREDLEILSITPPGSASSPGTIELTSTVINAAPSTDGHTIALGDSDNYTLTLKSDIATIGSASHTIGLDFTGAAGGSAIVRESLAGGWLGASTGKSFNYYKDVDKTLATITGLSNGFNTANVSLGTGGNSTTIYLKQGALTTANVSLSSSTYSLSLANADGTADADGKFGFDALSNAWGVSGQSALYYTHTKEGWTWKSGGKSVVYTSEEATRENQVVIANLAGGLSAVNGSISGITIKGKTVTLTQNVLNHSESTPVSIASGTGYTLKLSGADSKGKVGFDLGDMYWKVDGQSAYYNQNTSEGWTLANNAISYGALITQTFATITGLSGVTAGTSTSIAGVSLKSDGITFELGAAVLGTSTITIDGQNSKNKDYALGFAGTTGTDDLGNVTFGFGLSTPAFSYSGSSATLLQDKAEGWTLAGKSISYTVATAASATDDVKPVTLAVVSGLSEAGMSGGNVFFGTSAADSMTIYLKEAALFTGTSATLEGAGYTLQLANADGTKDANGKFGFEDSGLYWSVSGTSAYYQHDTAAGWTLNGNVVDYSASNADNGGKAQIAVKLSGLSNLNNYSESGAIRGITVTEKTFTHGSTSSKGGIISIDDEDLFGLGVTDTSKSISLELGKGIYTGDYTLALGASLATQTVAKYDREVNMSLSNSSGGKVSILGGLTDYFEVSGNSTTLTHYQKQENKVLATITGLSTTASASSVTLESSTITLGKDALTNGSVSAVMVGISGVPDYTFDLDDNVLTTENVLDDTKQNLFGVTIKDGTATITGKTKAYYKDNDSNIAYYGASTVTLGTITGISTAAKDSDFSFFTDGNGGLSIGLSNAVLAKGSGITLTTVDSITGANGFKLYFTEDNGTTGKDQTANDGAIGFVHGSLSWVHSGTQAIHRYDVGEGWTLADDGKSISYTGGKTGDNGTVLAKVTGLNGAYNNDALVAITDNGSSYTITLGQSALAARDINLITTGAASAGYSLKLTAAGVSSIGLDLDNEGSWVIEDGIASYQADRNKGWTLASTNLITYTPTETGAQVLAQIEGLKSGLKVNSEGQIAGISVASNKIILSNSVLGTDKITLKDTPGDVTTYILGLGGDVAQDDGSVTYWTTKGTTGTYKKDTQAYYSLSGTSSVVYTEATSKTLATLTNLPKGTTAASTGADRPATIDGIIVLPNSTGNGGDIKVGSDALSTDAKKFITLTNGEGSTYSLKLDDDVATTLPSHVWSYGTTTKLLKATTPATYSSDGKEIKYTAATMAKTAIFELGGVKKTVSEDDVIFYDDILDSTTQAYWKAMVGSISLAGASSDADLTHAVIVKDTALDNKNVTLTTKETDGTTKYKLLFFDTNLTDNISTSAPVVSGAGFTLSKTSAIYKGNITQGYTSSTDKKTGKVTAKYSAAKDGATLFTISGLPKDIANSDLISITVSTTTNSDGNYEVTVSADILKRVTGKLSIKGTGYVLKLPDPTDEGDFLTANDDRVTKGVDVWRVSGTTATYKKIKPAHYAIDAKATSISYVKEATFKVDKVDQIYAQIGGLPKGLIVEDDFTKNATTSKITNVKGGTAYITVAGTTSKTYTLDEAAYADATKIEFTPKIGTNALSSETLAALAAPSAITTGHGVWSVSGTTATLKTAGTSEGWEKNETTTKTTYTRKAAAASGSEILKISGLQKGLTVKTDGTIDGIDNSNISIDASGKVSGNVAVAASVYGTSNVTFKLGKNTDGVTYTAADVSAKTGQEIWTLSGTTLTIQKGTTASYTYDASKGTVTYKKANPTSTLVKITGLAKGVTLADLQDSSKFEFNESTKTITFKDKNLLGKSDITATNSYNIALGSGISSDLMVKYTPTWSYSGEKATLKAASSGGFDATTTTKNGKTTLKYNKASAGNVLLTIDKLQKGLSVTAVADGDNSGFANHIAGINDSGLDFSDDKSTIDSGVISVSDTALNSKTVTLKNASTTLSKATLTYGGTNTSSTTNKIWEISSTTGKLYNAEEEGYRDALTSNNTVITYYNGKTKASTSPLATVKGLKKSLKPGSDGQVEGIDVSSTTITLDSRALGTTNVSVSGTGGYTLALEDTGDYKVVDTSNPETTYKCTVKGTTVTIREFTPASYTLNASTGKIEYTGAKQGDIVATLSGVASGLKASADGSIEGIKIKETSGTVTVTLGKAALGTTDVTVKAADGKTVELAVDAGDSADPATTWQTTSDGNVILTTTYKQGYELAADNQSISYTDSGSVKTVISGFKGLSNTTASTTPPNFISFNTTNKTITVTDTNKVGTNGVAIAGGDYSLKLNSEPTPKWEINGTTATLYKTLTAGSYTCDGVKISEVTANRTQILATITGLPEDMTSANFDTTTKDADGNTIITFKTEATTKLLDNTTNIKLTGNGYKLAFADYDTVKPHETDKDTPVWSMKGTTATYAEGTTAGYTLSADGKTATYSAFALGKGKKAVATIKGLNSNYKPSDLTTDISSAKTVTLTADMLGTTDLELSGTGYKFDTTNANLPSEVKWKAEDAGTTQGWTVKSGTATYQDITGAYYSAGATKITYNAAKASTSARATITGLNKNLKAVDGEIEGIEVGGDYITLSNSVLASGNVTVSKGDYKLNLADDVPEPESTEPELSLSKKSIVTLKNSTSAGYTVNADGKGVTYSKAANNVTLATITGIRDNLTANEDGSIDGVTFDGDDNTITISDEALPTNTGAKVTLTDDSKGGYKLALDSTKSEDDVAAEDVWSFSNGTATFKNVKPKHYKLEGNTITYVGDTDLEGYATVTGITSFDESTNFGGDSTGGIITLKSTNLSTTKVASVQGSGFTFVLGDDSLESKVDDDTIAWNNSTANNVTTAKLTGKVTAGYLLENDSTKISYQNGNGSQTFAAIAGISSGQELETYIVDTENKVVELDSDQLTKAVTVSSSFEFSVSFDSDYDEASIAGTAGAENVVIAGEKVSVSLGGGDDHVTFDGNENVFYYGAGEGNDVITKFANNVDDIHITKGSITSAEVKGDDVVLTVKDGSTTSTITLKEAVSLDVGEVLNYTNSKGNPASVKVKAASADLLYEDESNFVTAGSQFDEITPVTPAAQSLDEDLTSPQNFKLLTRQNSLLAYLNSKKK